MPACYKPRPRGNGSVWHDAPKGLAMGGRPLYIGTVDGMAGGPFVSAYTETAGMP